MIDTYIDLFFILAAPAIGSFLALIAHRFSSGGPILFARSHCDFCKTNLSATDLIPIINQLWLKGYCRYCNYKINKYHISTEIIILLLVLSSYFIIGGGIFFWISSILCWLLTLISLIDIKYLIIPDRLNFILLISGLINLFFETELSIASALIGSFVGFSILYTVQIAFTIIRKQQGLGGGDVKFLTAAGVWIGWEMIPACLFIASLSALMFVILKYRSALSISVKIPFAPFLSVGLFSTYLLRHF